LFAKNTEGYISIGLSDDRLMVSKLWKWWLQFNN
jgi:hypothetical protein